MDWIVFGDDWGAHPSTTQHLVLNLPADDRVIWVDSIGMRSPKVNATDARRVYQKMRRLMGGESSAGKPSGGMYGEKRRVFSRVRPAVLPWHLNPLATRLNERILGNRLARLSGELGLERPILLSSTPVVVRYLSHLPCDRLIYLRLDDYERLPGVEPRLIQETESDMFRQADAVVATARALLPTGEHIGKGHYLPQGVNWDHFAKVSLEPSRQKILGFFGVVAPWVDFDLIRAVAGLAPDWTLEFIGKVEHLPADVASLPNVRFLPPVPFAQLPDTLSSWAAAWIPFEVSTLTKAVNPLKAREYLAAGLPTHCTPLPEVFPLGEHLLIASDPEAVVAWMRETLDRDSAAQRAARRESVRNDSWAQRSQELVGIATECRSTSTQRS